MKRFLITLLPLLTLLLGQMPLGAEMRHRDFTVRDGLAGSSVNSIFQDSKGRMWFGSWNGVSMFDGRNFTNFCSSPLDETTLSNDVIKGFAEHPNGNIWIATSLGINRLDLATRKCRRYYLGHYSTIDGEHMLCVDISPSGNVFCSASEWGLAWWDSRTDRMVPVNVEGISCDSIADLFCVNDDVLFIRSIDKRLSRVIYSIGPNGVEIKKAERLFSEEEESAQSDDSDKFSVKDLFKLSDGTFAMIRGDKISIIGSEGKILGKEMELPEGKVSYLSQAPDKKLHVVIDEKRLIVVDTYGNTLTNSDLEGLENILSICWGSQGTFWAGLDGLGVRMYYKTNLNFENILTKDIFGQNGGGVIAAAETDKEELLLSFMGSGLAFVKDGKATKLLRRRDGIEYERVFALAKNPEGDIFVGDETCLLIVTKDKEVIRLADLGARIYCLYIDEVESGCLWAGTFQGGLIKINYSCRAGKYKIEEMQTFKNSISNKNSLSSNKIMSIVRANDGKLWIGTLDGGINIFDTDNDSFKQLTTASVGSPISKNDILYLMRASDGAIWAGTGYGLDRIVEKGEEYGVEMWTDKDGLADNSVHAMLEDSNGKIWLSTSRGLSCLDPQDGSIINYNDERLISTYEFCNHSCELLSSGELFFGGVGGGCIFKPEEIQSRTYVPQIIFTDIFVRGKRLDLPEISGEIQLSHDENNFSIQFNALDYINNENCEYSYRLEGFDSWNNAGSSNVARYTNVPPGRYRFEVRSTNGDKIAANNIRSLSIHIAVPWWKSWWAVTLWILCVLSAAGLVFNIFRLKRNHRKVLEKEAVEKAHQKDTYEAKLRFFTNVAHEFGTPLTLITSSTEQLLYNGINGEKAMRNLRTINSSAHRMQKLIGEIMDFRKVDTGNYKPVYSKVNVSGMLKDIIADFSEINDANFISLSKKFPEKGIEMVSDASALEKILTNLISNAYKYTPKKGSIEVEAESEEKGFRFRVSNSGKGIRKEDLDKVFDRFRILDTFEKQAGGDNVKQNGVGMALVKSLTDMLSGRVEVESERNGITTFSLFIPGADESLITDDVPQIYLNDVSLNETEAVEEFYDEPSVPSSLDKGRPLVLAVDDDEKVRSVVAEILSEEYRVVTAGDGAEAIAAIMNEKPDIILSDMNMPKMDGLEFLKSIKAVDLTSNIPFIFLVFRSDMENEVKAYELGCDGIIYKPFNSKPLKAMIKGVLSRRKSLKEYYTSMISNMETFNGNVLERESREFLTKMIAIVENALSDSELSIDYVADKMCISKMKMHNSLKELTGQSPSEFITSVKINHATNLLKTTSLNVQEIMYASGFNNKSYFFREFKKVHGTTPKQFRDGFNA